MSQYLRIFVFTFLPLIIASLHIAFSHHRRTRQQVIELFLMYILGVSIGLNGIFSFAGHFFLSDMVAASIGWPTGNPFQLEVAFANLALGVLGILSVRAGVGFRTATAIVVTIFLFGANIVHIKELVGTGNYAPGNGIVQILSNFLRPIGVIVLLIALVWGTDSGGDHPAATQSARAYRAAGSNAYSNWPQILGSGLLMGGCFAIAGGIAGFMSGDMALWLGISTVLGVILGSGLQLTNTFN